MSEDHSTAGGFYDDDYVVDDFQASSHSLVPEASSRAAAKNPVSRIIDDRGRSRMSRPPKSTPAKQNTLKLSANKSFTKSNEWFGMSEQFGRKSVEDALDPHHVPKKCRFMRNGDAHFAGVIVVISAQRTRTFGSLLTELTRLMSNSLTLPQGVRFIFTTAGEPITTLDAFEDGGMYVCSSSNAFRGLKYEDIAARIVPRTQRKDSTQVQRNTMARFGRCSAVPADHTAAKAFVRPRFIYIIRNGISRPRQIFRILLNKKTAISLEQVLNTISKEISLDTGAVRKLYTLRGDKVTHLEDFFGADDVFLAYGQERQSKQDYCLSFTETKQLEGLGAILTYCEDSKNKHDSTSSYQEGFDLDHDDQAYSENDVSGEVEGEVDVEEDVEEEGDEVDQEDYDVTAGGDIGDQSTKKDIEGDAYGQQGLEVSASKESFDDE